MKRKGLFVFLLITIICSNCWTQEKTLKEYSTYKTSLTNNDIMSCFVNEVQTYLNHYDRYGCYYLVGYEVSRDKKDQNYAWSMYTIENKYDWGTVYSINLRVSNAIFWVKFSNTGFSCNDQSAQMIITTRSDTVGGSIIRKNIADASSAMINESAMVLKMYNDNYSDKSMKAFALNMVKIFF